MENDHEQRKICAGPLHRRNAEDNLEIPARRRNDTPILGRESVSDCMPGSKWEHRRFDRDRTVDLAGKVLECIPPRRLVLTWAEAADAADTGEHTRVAIDLEAVDDLVRLAVTHDEFLPGSDMWRKISNGWPRVLSSLKRFLETGRTLNTRA
jgi:uncharacterized protein YndB with AHSA1/START domain